MIVRLAGLALVLALWPALAAAAAPVDVQALVDAAPLGAVVTVPAGVHVGTVTIDHTIVLLGEPGATLDGEAVGSVLTIDAPDVEVGGLTITGGGRDQVGAPSGVLLTERADGTVVHDVAVRDSYIGVTVQRADDVTIERVSVLSEGIISGELHATGTTGEGVGDGQGPILLRGDGIWLFNTARSTVRDCVLDTVRDGIYVSFGHDQVLAGNQILNSRYAVHDMYARNITIDANTLTGNLSGIVMMYGGPATVTNNTITDSGSASTGFGAIVKDVGGATLRANVLADNRIGLDVDDAGRTVGAATLVDGNTIALNQVGVLLVPSADATFTGNAFIENTTQVVLNGTGQAQAIWASGEVGNYWSDYGGFDAHGDGTGDLPYTRSGRTGQLIASNPLLLALASGPAFRLLMAVEDRWAPTNPTVDDPYPLTVVPSPSMAAAQPAPRLPLWIPGSLMMVTGVVLLRGARRRKAPIRD